MSGRAGGLAPRPRALFYSSDAYGLGHLGICLTILREVAARRPDATLLLVTGSLQAHAFDLPANADYLKLPALQRAGQYAALPLTGTGGDGPRGIYHLREALLTQALLTFRPHVLHVDWLPAGQAGELRRALPALRAARPDATFVAGLPDVTDPVAHADWRAHGAYALLDELYDHLVVYADRATAPAAADYGLSPAAQARTTYGGYLAGAAPADTATATRARLGVGDRRLVLVTVGGGADGAPLLDAYLTAVEQAAVGEVASYIISGPLLPRAEHERLTRRAAALMGVTLVPFAADLPELLAAADAVVAMGGYNTSVSILYLRKRAVLVPRLGPDPEQLLRARALAGRGLVRVVRPDELTPARLAAALRAALDAPPPSASLDLGGAGRLAELIAGALPRRGRAAGG